MENKKNYKVDLENRLINFAVQVIKITDSLSNSPAGRNLSNQLVRSGTSSALNYGEAQSAESRKDFVHKIKIVLKELRETMVGLKIIKLAELYNGKIDLESVMKENDELLSIFVSSVNTALKNSTIK